jgi:hypothetical protein
MTAAETKRSLNFAPVSGAQSTLLRIAAGWFIFNGAFYGILLLVAIGALVRDAIGGVHRPWSLPAIALHALSAVGIVWTGILLGRGRRLGAYLMLFFLLIPLLFLPWQPVSATEVVFGVLGLIVIAAIWRELK